MKEFPSSTGKGPGNRWSLAFLLIAVCAWPAMQARGNSARMGNGPDAKPAETRVIASMGVKVLLEAVKGQAEKASGQPLSIEYGASNDLKAKIENGQPFEVVIVTSEVLDELIAKGKVIPGSRFDLAIAPIAIGERGDAPKADISSPAALKRTLLNASSIRFGTNGASAPAIVKMLDNLGVSETIKAKVNMPGDVQLVPGEYELSINLASEILPLKNLVYLGPIPKEFDVPVVMAAGIGSSGDRKTAKALIQFLKGPALGPVLKANGMQRKQD